jgi:hypothetical protein
MTSFRLFLHSGLLAAGLVLAFAGAGAQVASKPPAPMTVEEVVQLNKAGFSEEVIITKIKKNLKAFDLSTEELVELKKDGLSDNVIRFLLDPSQPYVPPAPPTPLPTPAAASPSRPESAAPVIPSQPAKQYPPDPNASKVPAEPGLYRFPEGGPLKIDVKLLLGSEAKGGLLKKGKVVAYIIGPVARTRIKEAAPIFYLRLAEGKAIEEIVLIALERKSDRRELEMGPSGKKQEFKAEAIRQFDSLEVGAQLFRIAPTKLSTGEYLFFQIGSAEPPKGSYGKGFDFGIEEPAPAHKKKN